MAQDLLVLALLTEFLLERVRSFTQDAFVLGAILLAFLLGVGDRLGAQVLRQGLSVAGLVIMVGVWSASGRGILVFGLFTALSAVYLFGKLARTLWAAAIGAGVLVITYWALFR